MMTLEEMQALLKESIPGKRYKHSVNVYETALKLAEAHGLPKEKIAVSGVGESVGEQSCGDACLHLYQESSVGRD